MLQWLAADQMAMRFSIWLQTVYIVEKVAENLYRLSGGQGEVLGTYHANQIYQ